ncbi:MAG: NgoFVII family restriction endonuclease [Leptospiraceae bacterium]|nr:NgoFVII family restriction endonuclease [Leptospiraceae bacterium]
MSLITTGLFDKVLIEPLNQNANKLYVVSGYATAMMAMRHFEFAKKIKKQFSLELIVGMSPNDGIEKKNHLAFIDLQSEKYNVDFRCNYTINRPPIHSKVYAWYNNDKPLMGFVGSANYTQNAFSNSMREVLTLENPELCMQYYNSLIGETVNCNSENIEEHIDIFEKKIAGKKTVEDIIGEVETSLTSNYLNLDKVTLTLLDSRTGEVPTRSGLNWGQREKRNPNQAYINIPADIGRSGFFPDRYETFSITTDDGKELICVRAQDGGKGLHSTLNNSLLGEYFRYRMGLKNGQFITKEDLLRYGRTDVTIYKVDSENYIMDFSVR